MFAATRDHSANYNFAYAYDPGGNRVLKTEVRSPSERIETTYVYDISNPATFGSANNRLMKEIVERVTPVLTGQPPSPVLITEPDGGTPPPAGG